MTNITDQMAAAGARKLDSYTCLDAVDPRQVARDVYAAMAAVAYAEVDRALADLNESPTEVDPPRMTADQVERSQVEWLRMATEQLERYQFRPLRPFAFAESQVYEVPADRIGRVFNSPQTATSDGRW